MAAVTDTNATPPRILSPMETATYTDGSKTIHLIGTSHISPEAPEKIKEIINAEQPDRVCIELDEKRLQALTKPEKWHDTDIMEAIRDGNGYMLLAQTLIGIYQRQIGDTVDVQPGADMIAAYNHATAHNIPTTFIDRDINETIQRIFNQLSLIERIHLTTDLLIGKSHDDIPVDPTKEDVQNAIAALGNRYPTLKTVMINERDSIMARKIQATNGTTIVAVVGAGHVKGILSNLKKKEKPSLPPKSSSGLGRIGYNIVKYGIPAAIIGMFVYSTATIGTANSSKMAYHWILLNSSGAAIGSIIARSHPATLVTATATAPFTSINPALPAGLVAAWIENYIRPPRVSDLVTLQSLSHIRDLWSNRATRLLLIFVLVNLGSAIATFIGTGVLASFIA